MIPQRYEVAAEYGHDVAVMKALSVKVDVGAKVTIVAGRAVKRVSVNSVIMVTSKGSALFLKPSHDVGKNRENLRMY